MSEPTPATPESAPAPAPETTTATPTTTTDMPPKPEPEATPVAPAIPQATKADNAPAPEPVKEEEPEPQNSLTKKFTDAEWKALKQFRKEIPSILAAAYTDKADAKSTPITLWSVTIDPTNLLDAKVSVILLKFLRARNLNPEAAKTMMVATLRWRDEFGVDAAIKEEHSQEIFGKAGYIYGKDKEGRPVIYNVYGGDQDLKQIFGDVQRFLRWRVALMEKSIALLDFENIDQTVQIHDYEGVSMSSRDANSKQAASEASSIFGSHYPEMLHKKYFVNVPTYMTWIFWLFKPLLPAATLAKMSVVGSGPSTIGKALLPTIDAKDLPKSYGGEAEGF